MRIMLLVMGMALMTALAPAQHLGGRIRPPRYDPAKEVTIQGTVDEVLTAQGGAMRGVHVTVKAAKNTFDVRLGPVWFLEQNNFVLAKGDRIEVTGAKALYRGAEVMIAREVKKGNTVLTLRDPNGVRRWLSGGLGPTG